MIVLRSYSSAGNAGTLRSLFGTPGGVVIGTVSEIGPPKLFERADADGFAMGVPNIVRVYRDATIRPLRWLRPHPGITLSIGTPLVVRYDTQDVAGGFQVKCDEYPTLEPAELVLLFLDEDRVTGQVGPAHADIKGVGDGKLTAKNGAFVRTGGSPASWRLNELTAAAANITPQAPGPLIGPRFGLYKGPEALWPAPAPSAPKSTPDQPTR
ncbi:MAG TPA: hypothetical protein VGN26_03785 [Armatimonadota bacterium]